MSQTQPLPSLTSLARVVLEDAKSQRSRGKQLQYWVLGIGLVAVVIQALPTFIDPKGSIKWLAPTAKDIAYASAVLSLILQVARWVLQRSAAAGHALGSTIKRRALLCDSLGPSPERLDLRLLRESAGAAAESRARTATGGTSYYASQLGPGLPRLRENLQESAFFSHRLYSRAARSAFLALGVIAIGIVIGLIVVASYVPRETGLVIANCVLVFVSFVISADLFGRALDWHAAAITVERIERRLEAIEGEGLDTHLAAFADYETATALAPPVPTALYEKERKRLDELWASRTQ